VPHAAHFLQRLDRVPRSLVDLALALYRDEDRVKWILRYAHLAADDERVALALDPGGGGPYVVVGRDGAFITALGAGMKPSGLTVLSRAQIDVFSARVDDARRRQALAREVVPQGKKPTDVLRLLTTRPGSLTREEFTAIAGWAPLLEVDFLKDVLETAPQLEALREQYLSVREQPLVRRRLGDDMPERLCNFAHGIAARLLLATMGDLGWVERVAAAWDEDFGLSWYATRERVLSVAVRGAWAAARMGKAFLPVYKKHLASPDFSSVTFDAVLAVTAIGIRHSHYRQEARRIVATLVENADPSHEEWARQVQGYSERAFLEPEASLAAVKRAATSLLVALGQLLPPGSPYRITRAEDAPGDLALLLIANQNLESITEVPFMLLPWVAKLARAEELYLPADLERAMRLVSKDQGVAGKVYDRHAPREVKAPERRSAPKVGRNEPCPCGSGRKFKRCCAA